MFSIRWQVSRRSNPQEVEYPAYGLAEAAFIGLFTIVDRDAGGWGELWQGGRLVVRMGVCTAHPCPLSEGEELIGEQEEQEEQEEQQDRTAAAGRRFPA